MMSVPTDVSKYMGSAVKLAEIWGTIVFNVKAYGAKGNNSHIDTLNIQNAISDAAVSGGVVVFPPGTYITGNLTIPSNVTLSFTNGANLSVTSGSTVTINGWIDAGLYQIFSGSGTVSSSTNKDAFPQWFGAKGDGATDDTSAIQKALNFSLSIKLPQGMYVVTSTLTGRPNQVIRGETPETCQFFRTTAYGHTLKVDGAGALLVEGIWFRLLYTFNNGSAYIPGTSTSVTNKDPDSSHLRVSGGQDVRVFDCWFDGLGHGIEFIDSTILWVDRCNFNGMWDKNVVGLQASLSAVYLHASTADGRCGLFNITNCHIGGYGHGAPVSVTTGNVTVTKELNAGMKYGVFIESCERFVIGDNYIGGQSYHNIYLSAKAILSHGVIRDNLIDSAGEYSILFESLSSTYYVSFVSIHNNTGVGYGLDQGFLRIKETGFPLMASQVSITDNMIQYYLRAPILLETCKGIKIANNTVAAYNSDGSTDLSDPYILSGCVVNPNTSYVDSVGNTWGGGINVPDVENNCRWGIYFVGTSNCTAALERSAGMSATVVAGISQTYPT